LENEKQAKENLTGSAAFNGGPREKPRPGKLPGRGEVL